MEKIRIPAVEKSIDQVIIDTFKTMLSMDLAKVGLSNDPGLDDQRYVASVHFAGEVVGTLGLNASREFACLIGGTMLGMEPGELDEEEVKDVLGELSNIVSGNLKSDFLDSDLACVISTPAITRGSDFKIEPSKVGEHHQWVYRYKTHEILIEINLKEDIGAKKDIFRSATLSAEEIREKINSVDVGTTVINSVIDVFYTMLSMEIESIQEVPTDFREEKRTVGTVSFAGDVHGMFNIQVNDNFARKMAAAMLGIEEEEIGDEEEVFDVIRELSNIIGGNLKSSFVDVGLACVLSTPSITNGLDFHVEALNIIKIKRFLFHVQGHTIIVDAGIKKDASADTAEDDPAESDGSGEEGSQQVEGVDEGEEGLRNLELIMEIPLEVRVELGRTRKRVQELLKMGHGSVLGLVQLEGEPVDLLVNDTLIAKGEVMVDKEKYGIRIVEVVSRAERVISLK
jgi:flagellar motor switch protein FliN/FliY